jgi:hypothetical protein
MRRRRYLVAPAILVVLVLLAVLGAQLRSDHKGSGRPPARVTTGAAAPPAAPAVPALLLAHRGPSGRVDLAAVVAARAGSGGSVVLLPTLTSAETPSFDPQLLADQVSLGGPQLLQTTVQNLLGVRVERVAVLDDASLAGVLEAAGPLTVNLRGSVDVGGSGAQAFPAGSHELPPSDVATLLTSPGRAGELEHLVTVQAVLEGWLRALRSPQVAAASQAGVPDMATLAAATQGTTRFATLPVDAVSGAGSERYQVRAADLASEMRSAFPDRLLSIGGRRPRVEILNGTGIPGQTQQVAARVVPAGGEVVKTGNSASFGQSVTQVVYYRDENRPAAESLVVALGGQVLKATADVGVFDVTVITGADFKPTAGT